MCTTKFSITIRCIITDQRGNVLLINNNGGTSVKSWNIISGSPHTNDSELEHTVRRILRTDANISESSVRLMQSKLKGAELELWYLCAPISKPESNPQFASWQPASLLNTSQHIPNTISKVLLQQELAYMGGI